MVGIFFRNMSVFFVLCFLLSLSSHAFSQDIDDNLFSDDSSGGGQVIADPLEPINRVFFQFNDKFYFWVLKPVAKSYTSVLHKDITIGVANIFRNILSPIRIINNFLQGKFHDSGVELSRFVINSTLGMGGLADQAKDTFGLSTKKEDFGQTLGSYGAGEGIYICWPLFGPSNIRDTFGLIGDLFLSPITYLSLSDGNVGFLVQTAMIVSDTAQEGGRYEDFKESSFDPYTAMRDFYTQSRRSKIEDKNRVTFNQRGEVKATMINEPVCLETRKIGKVSFPVFRGNGLNNIARLSNVPTYFAHGTIDSLIQKSNHTGADKLGMVAFL